MPNERRLHVGKLVIHGRDIRFQQAPSLDFDVNHDERAILELSYAFDEASLLKEEALIRFIVRVPEGAGGTQEARLTDGPFAKTRLRGTLRQELGLPHAPTVKGNFEIEASYDKRAWFGLRRRLDAVFEHMEPFHVIIRSGRPATKPWAPKRR